MLLTASITCAFLLIIGGLILEGIFRKLSARMQNRIGPPIIQPIYDLIKLCSKESIMPINTRSIFPSLTFLSAYLVLVTIMFAFFDLSFYGDIILILILMPMSSIFYALAGWDSKNPYGFIGFFRETIQMIGYESLFILTILMVVFDAQSVTLSKVMAGYHILPASFLIFFIFILSKLHKPPFHIPDADTEIVAGPTTEYGGLNLAFIYLAHTTEMVACIFLASLLFFGKVWYLAFILLSILILLARLIFARLRIDQSFKFYFYLPFLLLIDIGLILLA